MIQEYWWAVFIGLALLAVLVLWLVLGRRRGVGTEAAASLRDLDGAQSARPTFARVDPMVSPSPLATGSSVFVADPMPVDEAMGGDAVESATVEPLLSEPTSLAEDDDLTRMKGLGPKLRDRLAALGVTRFDQIAAWDDAAIDRIDAELGTFTGRIRRDDWVDQARFLAADDVAGYQARFGALG